MTTNKPTKIRRKRIRARIVNGVEALQQWGYAYARHYYVIDALGIVKQDDFNCEWFAVNPEALKLADGELVLGLADRSVTKTALDYDPYERYIIEFCDQHGNVIDTAR
jgi:hypothetical protein